MWTSVLVLVLACTGKDTTASGDSGVPIDCEPAVETCDGVDNDCDGRVDEDGTDLVTIWADVDGDGFGDDGTTLLGCGDTSGFVTQGGDCDDADAEVNPDADEICDGQDNDCDELIDDDDDSLDPDSVDPVYPDADGDGFGDRNTEVLSCDPPTDHVSDGTDCDDSDHWVYPGATELCDGKKTNCEDDDWVADAGLASFYSDTSASWTDLTALLGAGTEETPVYYTLDDGGALGLCEGQWHVALTIEQAVQVVGVDGAASVVLSGDDTHSIVIMEDSSASVTLTHLTLERGLADHTITLGDNTRDAGGAVWCSGSGTLTLDGVTLTGNVSSGYGGAVAVQGCRLSMSRVTATDNHSYQGGVVYARESAVTVEGSDFEDNVADVEGGAFYLGGGVTFELSDSSFVGQDAYQGGAIRAEVRDKAGPNMLTVIDTTFTVNTATQGGAIAVDDGGMLTLQGCTLSDNLAYERGGALFLSVDGLVVTSSLFDGNQALDDGGAIAVSADDMSIDGSTFSGNSAEDGGALVLDADRGLLTDTTFESNAASRSGGAVASRHDDGVLEATGVSFSGNTADRDGGAIYTGDGARFSCESCGFSDNTALRSGGAIGAEVSDVHLQDSTLENNTAGEGRAGGAIWVDNGNFTANSVTFSGNSASTGGAIALELGIASLASVIVQDNTADEGGGIYLSLSALNVSRSDFSGNSPDDTYVDDADQSATWGTGASFSCDLDGCE